MTDTIKTRSAKVQDEITASLKARNPLTVVVTREEARVERYLFAAAAAAKYVPRTWDVAAGVCEFNGEPSGIDGSADPGATMNAISERAKAGLDEGNPDVEQGLWIMRDLLPWLQGQPGAATLRQLRNLVRMLPGIPPRSGQAIILISPTAELPPELSGHATVIEWPLPDRAEIGEVLDIAQANAGAKVEPLNGNREKAIDAAIGLSEEEAETCYSKSLVQLRRIDPVAVGQEKKRVIAKSGVLEWYDPLPGGLAAVGGLENLKAWALARTLAYSPEAKAYGLQAPKGVALIGVPGCGKTMVSKALSTLFECPLLRADLNALKGKFVGQSEANIRKMTQTVDAVGRAVLWIDEIEKALAGATQGAADGGVSADALGTILTWMQERQGETFVVVTANDVEALPPELLRAGRFDAVWFVDLPTVSERAAILKATLKTHKRPDADVDALAVAQQCKDFTGAEVAALVPEAMFAAFADGKRELATADLIKAAQAVVPLSVTAAEKIARLRNWAKGRARPASAPEVVKVEAVRGRVLG